MPSPVTDEYISLRERKVTEVTLERSNFAVNSHVFLHVCLFKESLLALGALKVSDLCVQVHVSVQVRDLDKPSVTFFTSVWSFS